MKSGRNPDEALSHLSSVLREVEADFVNPFLTALNITLKSMTMGQSIPHKGALSLVSSNSLAGDILISLRVEGMIKGLVVLSIQDEISKKLVSSFLFGVPIVELDEMAKNSLMEFSLRIAEVAHTQLINQGYAANVTFHINYNKPVQFSREHQFLVVPLKTEQGQFNIFFNIMKADSAQQPPQSN